MIAIRPVVVNVAKEKMPQLDRLMSAPKPINTIYAQLTSIAQKCGLQSNEFSIVEDSVLLDGEELLKRSVNLGEVVLHLTEPYVGVTVVLPGLVQRESSLRNSIAVAGGSCHFRTSIESFEQIVELAQVRRQRAREIGAKMAEVGFADPGKNRQDPDELRAYSYTLEEQDGLRQIYESTDESGSVLS